MTWPTPRPGLVIRYSYLWSREARAGQEEGLKDRPCAIILALEQDEARRVYVLPITHTPPSNAEDAVELPPLVKARLGLDAEPSWVVLREANSFAWPGPDLRPLPGQGMESVALGFLPPSLFRMIRDRFVAHVRARRPVVTARTSDLAPELKTRQSANSFEESLVKSNLTRIHPPSTKAQNSR